jgi:hypothetical protein
LTYYVSNKKMASQSYTFHHNPTDYHGESGHYLTDTDDRIAPSITRRSDRRERRRLQALTPSEEDMYIPSGRYDCEDRAPWRVAAASEVEKLKAEIRELRSTNEQLREQLRDVTTEAVDSREESNDLRRELRKARSIIQRSRKLTVRYKGESIQEFLKDIKGVV